MSKDDLLKLDNQLCFVIYACSRGLTQIYRPLLAELGVTYPQYLVLLVLWEKDGVTVKKLGERLFLDSGTLTPLLKRMEVAGFIKRERSIEDERKVNIYITRKGLVMKKKAYAVPETLLCQSGLTLDQFVGLKSELETLLKQIHNIDSNKDTCG